MRWCALNCVNEILRGFLFNLTRRQSNKVWYNRRRHRLCVRKGSLNGAPPQTNFLLKTIRRGTKYFIEKVTTLENLKKLAKISDKQHFGRSDRPCHKTCLNFLGDPNQVIGFVHKKIKKAVEQVLDLTLLDYLLEHTGTENENRYGAIFHQPIWWTPEIL